MGAISLDDVTKAYDPVGEAVVAVEDLNIDIKDGEFLVLVGPSGCGKSTTLRMVAGLESITEGTISIGGEVVNDAPPKERNIAMVFQNYALYPHMTVRENIGFGLKYSSDLGKADRRERAEEVAEMMGIEELLDDTPDQLSGGQQQRVALGRAIVREPEAFLFDEPLSNLDAKLRTRMRTEIARLQRELGVTSVYVTHDQAEAMTMGDRIAVINDGELQQIGVPNEVYEHPENRFVAGFIGSPRMNFIEATLDSRAGSSVLVDRAGNGECLYYEVTESIMDGSDLEPGDDVTVGVRPEDLHVSTGEVDDDHRVLQATVDVVEPMGSDNFITVDVGDQKWVARVDSSFSPPSGTSVTASFDPYALHLFAADGRTIKSQGIDEKSFHDSESATPTM
jgi:multiple sugar transport system ATP-binding protein